MNIRHGIQDHRPPFSPGLPGPGRCAPATPADRILPVPETAPPAQRAPSRERPPAPGRLHTRQNSPVVTLVLAALLLLLPLFVSCGERDRLPRLDTGKTILAFGDSLTAGNGAGPGQSYPEVLQGLLGIRVVKSGVPGEVSAEGLRRLPGVLAETRPDLVILCHGGNDFLRRMDTRQTAQNLRAMIALARERGAAVVLLAVPAPGPFLNPPGLYREAAAELSVPLEERILKEVLSDGSLKADPIHPNAEGYARMARAVAALLKKHGAVP